MALPLKRILGSLALMTMAAGCGDPVVGTWHAQSGSTGCVSTVFEVDGDLTGIGNGCDCHFEFELTPGAAGSYDADVNFESGCLPIDGHYTCELHANDQELDCGILGSYDKGAPG